MTQRLPYEPSSTGSGNRKEVQKTPWGEGAHHLDKVIVRTHRQVEVKGGVGRSTPERQFDVLLDLLMVELLHMSIVPSRGTSGTISSSRCIHRISGITLYLWNMTITPAPVKP
jgi:hypothetical protein